MPDRGPDVQTASEAMRPLVVVCILYILLDIFFVSVRFASRLFIRRSEVGWDDWLIIPACVCNIGACVCGILVAQYESRGNGPANAPIILPEQIASQLEPTLKAIFASIILLIFSLTLPKLSILALYLRIFTGRRTRAVTYILMGFVGAMAVAFLLALLLLCSPMQYFWDKTLVGGQCLDFNLYVRSFGLPNILIDVAMLIAPLPAIWGLEASVARRVGVTLVFLTGIIALIASCIRWDIYARADATIIKPNTDASLLYINIIECSTYLIAACLPASYPAINALIPTRIREHFQQRLRIRDAPPRPTPSPALRRMSPQPFTENAKTGSFSRLVETPTGTRSPMRARSPLPRIDGRRDKLAKRESREQLGRKNSMQMMQNEETKEDNVSMSTHGRSQSRAETVRREEDEEMAMAELRRLASQHQIHMPFGGDGAFIGVHTEIEVTHEEKVEEDVDST